MDIGQLWVRVVNTVVIHCALCDFPAGIREEAVQEEEGSGKAEA